MIALERILLWLYAIAVFLPITIPWVVLGAGIAVSVVLAVKQKCATAPPLLKPILFFVIVVFISGLINNGFGDAFDSVISLRALLVYFWAFYALSILPEQRKNVILILLCVGALDGIWGGIQQLFDFHPFDNFKYLQATGFVRNPMAFAGEMQVTSILSLALLLSNAYKELKSPFNNKWLFLFICLANFSGVIFASERSAWLGIALAVLVVAFLVSRQLFFKTALAGILLVGLLWFTVPVVSTRLAPLLTNFQNDTSTKVRLSIWVRCMDMWSQNPILGRGINHFPKLDYKEAVVPGISEHLTHAHSNYFHLLVSLGVVGLVAYFALLASIFVTAWRNWKLAETALNKALGLGALGALVSLSVAGIFEYNFGAGHVRLIQWFLFAFLLGLNALSGPAKISETEKGDNSG